MSQFRPFNIMAKPVSGTCNLNCRYCYYLQKPQELYPDVRHPMMPPDVLDSFTRQYLQAMPQQCDFGWQGGEPLLAGKEFYKQAIALQAQHCQPGQKVGNNFQTNGTLLDDEWCEFFAANKFLIGLSLDGPPQWHDAFRRDHSGSGSSHLAWRGLELLQKHHVEFNVLITLNSITAPHAADIYRYFVNRGIRYLQFIPILERDAQGNPTDFSCTPLQFGRYMLDVFNVWSSRDMGKVSERWLDNVIHTLIYGSSAMCCYAPTCANAFVLEHNGDLYACDHFVFSQWRIGNIMQRPLVELLYDPRLEEFGRLKTSAPLECQTCRYVSLCNGGCPKHHVPIGTDSARLNYFCDGYKAFFEAALPELQRVAKFFANGQMPPPAKPTPADTGNSAGRNAPCPCGSGRKMKHCCGKKGL